MHKRQRQFNKLTGQSNYIALSSDSLSFSWEDAIVKTAELESCGEVVGVFIPLPSAELKLFPKFSSSLLGKEKVLD